MPLVYASPPSVRKPAFKRRRLNHALDPGCQPSRALTDNSNVAPAPTAPSLSLCAKPSCSTCHRALSTAIRPGVVGSSTCSRCVVFSPALALPSKVGVRRHPAGSTYALHSVLTYRRTDALPRLVRSARVPVHLTPAPRPSRLPPPSRARRPPPATSLRPSLPSVLRSASATPR